MHKLYYCLFLLVVTAGCGDLVYNETKPDPIAKIDGPDTVTAGDPVQLSSNGSVGGPPEWKVVPSEASKNIFYTKDGIVFASRQPGVYTFIMGVASGDRCSIAIHELNNQQDGKPTPSPTPVPVKPEPKPDQPVTGWESKLESDVKLLVSKAGPTDEKRGSDLRGLADSIDICADLADKGAFSTMAEARAHLRESNRKVLEDRLDSWKNLRDGIEQLWSSCEKDGKIPDFAGLSKVWRITARGLRQ